MNKVQNTNSSQSTQSIKRTIDSTVKSFQGLIQKILYFQKQIVQMLDQICEKRVVQKLARPIDLNSKKLIIEQFTKNLNYIHARMKIMENQLDLNYLLTNDKDLNKTDKSKKRAEQIIFAKLSFFNIRKKYTQCFVHSSFIYFRKVIKTFDLKFNIQFIDADKWLSKCLQKAEKGHQNNNSICCL